MGRRRNQLAKISPPPNRTNTAALAAKIVVANNSLVTKHRSDATRSQRLDEQGLPRLLGASVEPVEQAEDELQRAIREATAAHLAGFKLTAETIHLAASKSMSVRKHTSIEAPSSSPMSGRDVAIPSEYCAEDWVIVDDTMDSCSTDYDEESDADVDNTAWTATGQRLQPAISIGSF